MSSSFSWADRLNIAANACLPCLHRTSSTDSLNNPRATNSVNPATGTTGLNVVPDDDLRRLLVDSDSDALSLHSDIGNTNRTARRRSAAAARRTNIGNGGWGITLFGYHLFGRPTPPIQLPTSPSDDDDSNGSNHGSTYDSSHSHHRTSSRRPRRGSITFPDSITRTTTLHSTATFDSDATPLDVDTIDSLSGTQAAALALAEEVERRAKEERRAKRRERREMKKMARALAVQASVDDEFEGFQGSGQGVPTYSQWPVVSTTDDAEQVETETVEDRVPSPTQLLPHLAMNEEEDDEGADLDGMAYTRRRRAPPSTSRYSGGSDSRSRTSTSTSTSLTKPSKHEKKSKKSRSSHRSKSTLSSNDSTSIASPTSLAFHFAPHEAGNVSIATVISPTTVEQGQGFFDYGDDEEPAPISAYNHLVAKDRITREFPSAGFGAKAGMGARDGAFLANTGSAAAKPRTVDGEEGDDSFDGTF